MNRRRLAYAVVTLALGALALASGLRARSAVDRGRDWPTTPGRILERGLGPALSQRGAVQPHVRYAYEVDGRAYEHTQVFALRSAGGAPSEMQALVDGLPDPVPVRYDPSDPQDAYLLANPPSTRWSLLVAGGVLLAAGLLALATAFAPRARAATPAA